MRILCPTCRQPLVDHEIPVEMLVGLDFTPKERAVLRALAEVYPSSLSTERVIFALYGDDVDGGPVTADRAVHQFISRIRKRLPAYGWNIPKSQGGRGSKGFYRLARIEGAQV